MCKLPNKNIILQVHSQVVPNIVKFHKNTL